MARTYKKVDIDGKGNCEFTDSNTHLISLEQLEQKLNNLEVETIEVKKMIKIAKGS